MNDRKMRANPNSLANLDKGRELRKKQAIRSTFTLRPETVSVLKRLGNMSEGIDTMVEYVNAKGLAQEVFIDYAHDRKRGKSLNTKDMNDRNEELELQSQSMNDRIKQLEAELEEAVLHNLALIESRPITVGHDRRVAELEAENNELWKKQKEAEFELTQLKAENKALQVNNSRLQAKLSSLTAQHESTGSTNPASIKEAIAILNTLIATPSNKGRVSKEALREVVRLLGA